MSGADGSHGYQGERRREEVKERLGGTVTEHCGTVRVAVTDIDRTRQNNNHNTSSVGGSHRVLLKLRRLSGGTARPKSVPDLNELTSSEVNFRGKSPARVSVGDIKRLNSNQTVYKGK